MRRKSRVISITDTAGPFEVELFEASNPKSVVVCAHGNGVRRWDGEMFFLNIANHYSESVFYLVDQNQTIPDGCQLNELPIMAARVQAAIEMAQSRDYPGSLITILAHSMGCGVTTQLNLAGIEKVIFVAPGAGNAAEGLIERYGIDVANGRMTRTSDGNNKYVTKQYFQSVEGIIWEDEYEKLLARFKNVAVFESGDEEIVGEERFKHRSMPFASYQVIPGAKHNYSGVSLELLEKQLDKML